MAVPVTYIAGLCGYSRSKTVDAQIEVYKSRYGEKAQGLVSEFSPKDGRLDKARRYLKPSPHKSDVKTNFAKELDIEKPLDEAIEKWRACKAKTPKYMDELAHDVLKEYLKQPRNQVNKGWSVHHPDMVLRVVLLRLRKFTGCLHESSAIERFLTNQKQSHELTHRVHRVEGKIEGVDVVGVLDGIIDGDTVLEIKTLTNGKNPLTLRSVMIEHDVQVHVYMHLMGFKKAIVVYSNETHPHQKVFRVRFQDDFWQSILEKFPKSSEGQTHRQELGSSINEQ